MELSYITEIKVGTKVYSCIFKDLLTQSVDKSSSWLEKEQTFIEWEIIIAT